jgi:hypothetical protein
MNRDMEEILQKNQSTMTYVPDLNPGSASGLPRDKGT